MRTTIRRRAATIPTPASTRSAVGAGHDVGCGDNCSIRRPVAGAAQLAGDDLDPARSIVGVVRRQVQLYDVGMVGSPAAAGTSDDDDLFGEGGYDILYGQGGNDDLDGGASDDYLEGNAGVDTIHGMGGQDDIIGGTGRTTSDDPATAIERSPRRRRPPLRRRRRWWHRAGDDYDVIMGDNATVLRGAPGQAWHLNTFNASVKRSLYLYDVATTANAVDPATNGGDVMRGEANDDVMYGQGDADDMAGGGGDDYMEGNEANDSILGGLGNDDLIGGTGRINDDPAEGTDGRLDVGETIIAGGPGFDHLAGDNAIIERVLSEPGRRLAGQHLQRWRPAPPGHPAGHRLAQPCRRSAGVSGADNMEGNADDDVMHGQGGDDQMLGDAAAPPAGDGQDYVEGNAGSDTIRGGRGQDDLLGGTGLLRLDPAQGVSGRFDGHDQLRGEYDESEGATDGDGGDWIFGDNAIVDRPLTPLPEGDWKPLPANGVIERSFLLLDIETVGAPADSRVHGDDTAYGNDNDDTIFGQGGNDLLHGNAGDDYIEGNHANDTIYGDGDQDDLIGGSVAGNRLDGVDSIYGGPAADFEAGDNARILRPVDGAGQWKRYVNYNPTTIVRTVERFDVGGPAGTAGGDYIEGNDGDDYQWGQDGNDTMHGNNGNDDMLGELGDDVMFGGYGEDAMVGDRGRIIDTKLADNSKKVSIDTKGPAFMSYVGLVAGQLDRRVSLTNDGDGAPYPMMGIDTGGADRMRGGPGHDSMHGAFGDDIMNGDSQGDWLFGDDGADVMWGGKGADPTTDPADPADPTARDRDGFAGYTDPFQDRYVDYLFGGHGGLQSDEVLAADILDYLPRTADPSNGFAGDPQIWFEMTDTHDADPTNDQYHQGKDWIYGGFDRDVMEGDLGKNGPDDGDRLIDWNGAFNLYTHCNASYGDDDDIRSHSPKMQEFLHTMAYGSGAGDTQAEVTQAGTSAYRELALVYPGDKGNSGKAFPTTPGHFQEISCAPGGPRQK